MQIVCSFMQRWIGAFPMALGLAPAASVASSAISGLSPSLATAGGEVERAGEPLISLRCRRLLSFSFLWIAAQAVSLMLLGCGGSIGARHTVNPLLPQITSLTPISPAADGANFNLGINGANFTPNSTSTWGATPLSTTYLSTTKLTALLPASLIATPNTASITVSTEAGTASATVSTTGGTSPQVALTVSPSPPTITSLSPNSVVAGGQALTLTINGANFLPGTAATVVRWNYTALATTYVSSTQLTAFVPATLTGGSGTINITVVTVGGTSSAVPFTINPAQPVITGLSPSRVPAGYGAFVLYISGTHFSSNATVNWGTTPLVTSPPVGATLAAQVPASLVASVGLPGVTVTTAGGTSAPFTFNILQPQPVIASLSPSSAAAGGAAFTMTINGANFNSTSFCFWQSIHLPTTYVSPTQLTVAVPASMIAIAGTSSVAVYTLGGSGVSTGAAFIVNPAPPAISSLSPATVTAGSAGFMLTIMGKAFTPAATSMWGTTPLGTVYVNPTQLIAAVPASLIVESGTGSLTVTTPAGTSAPASLPIKQAAPEISGLSPGVATAGGAAFTLTVNGEYFTPASTAKWGSTALTTTYINETQLTAAVPAKLISSAGSANITVAATGTSAPAVFTVYQAPKIVTATLPSGTVGSAYSGPIEVAGGVPGYTWTVTGLPNSLGYYNTSGSTLTITGTPATPGAVIFQVSVQDSGGGMAGPVTYTLNVAGGPNGANNGNLNGSYACIFQGFVDDDNSRWASLASFQADGQGHFSSGIFDTNSRDIGTASGTITGSYNIGSDNNGLASLHTILTDGAAGIQTMQWAIALSSAAQPAQEFRMVEVDDLDHCHPASKGPPIADWPPPAPLPPAPSVARASHSASKARTAAATSRRRRGSSAPPRERSSAAASIWYRAAMRPYRPSSLLEATQHRTPPQAASGSPSKPAANPPD